MDFQMSYKIMHFSIYFSSIFTLTFSTYIIDLYITTLNHGSCVYCKTTTALVHH